MSCDLERHTTFGSTRRLEQNTMKKYQVRQGDVLVQATTSTATGKEVPRKNGRVILAHGEATGHAHAIAENGATLRTTEQATLLEVTSAIVMLRHDEHATIEIPNGTHEVIRQREYTPQAIRNVAD